MSPNVSERKYICSTVVIYLAQMCGQSLIFSPVTRASEMQKMHQNQLNTAQQQVQEEHTVHAVHSTVTNIHNMQGRKLVTSRRWKQLKQKLYILWATT